MDYSTAKVSWSEEAERALLERRRIGGGDERMSDPTWKPLFRPDGVDDSCKVAKLGSNPGL